MSDRHNRFNYAKALCYVWVRRFYPHVYNRFMELATEKFPKLRPQERRTYSAEMGEIIDKVGKGE